MKTPSLFFLSVLMLLPLRVASAAPPEVRFTKIQLTDSYYCDGVDAADIDGDGHVDVVAGPFWYAGPDFQQTHEFYPAEKLPPEVSPSNSMFSFVHDLSGDGRPDILVLGRIHKHAAYWYENPGSIQDKPWAKHFAFKQVRGESPALESLLRGTSKQLICHWEGQWGWIEPQPEHPRAPWQFVPVGDPEEWPQFYHGEGVADLNGDGRNDLIINDGWYEQPEQGNGKWLFHRGKFSEGRGGAQIFAYDVDGDGDRDVISALDGHGWGLAWFEQLRGEDGSLKFKQHRIMGDRSEIEQFGVAFSQPHALALADIDGDGLQDIVCGKRMWAHGPKGDIEPNADPVLYWFQLTRPRPGGVRFVPHLIDSHSGVGVQLTVKDVNNDRRPDILTASKLGTFVFLNRATGEEEVTVPRQMPEEGSSRKKPDGVPYFQLSVIDEAGAPLPCRVLLKSETGNCLVPENATTLVTGRDTWFMSPGRTKLRVPNGRHLLRVEHGLEFVRFKEWIGIDAAGEKKTVQLRRWVNMRERGYLSGENHLHVDTQQLASMLAAEGLDFGSSLTWWRGQDPRRPVPSGDGSTRVLSFAGHTSPTSVFDAELEYAWGAAYIQNLPAPMPLVAEKGRPNLDYLKHAVRSGAIVHYQGGWSREVLLDALHGCVHTVNICNNNFALHRFQPRSRYSNLLKVKGFPVYPDTDTGMLQLNIDSYYRLLNCGLPLAAGAGSATGVKQTPAGYNRTYVRVPTDATIKDFYDAWKRGNNFVTNGPVLQLATTSGQWPGDTVEFPAGGGSIEVKLEVLSDQPLQSAELILNGEVVDEIDVADPHHIQATRELRVEVGSWIAARCTSHDDLLTDDELEAYADRGSSPGFSVAPSRLHFAHTSPIYVTVGGRSVVVPRSVNEGLQILDRFKVFATEVADPHYLPPILSAVDEARTQLKRKLEGNKEAK